MFYYVLYTVFNSIRSVQQRQTLLKFLVDVQLQASQFNNACHKIVSRGQFRPYDIINRKDYPKLT